MFGQPSSTFSIVGDILTNWFTLVLLMAGLGVAAGLLIFVFLFPGKPKIGVIDIPFTVITDRTTNLITDHLEYARRDDSIKGVVIKLTSPGGGAAASERLYRETERLAEEKPVVVVMNGLVASGGYMMAMGATHSYAQTSSLVGNVGVVSFQDALVPPLDTERLLITGPYKRSGFSRAEWLESLEDLKEAFAQMVVFERGDNLKISKDELAEGRIYTGIKAVRLGLVDELGGDNDAFAKAADLAGISSYGLVDVNLEVFKKSVEEMRTVFPSFASESETADTLALFDPGYGEDRMFPEGSANEPNASLERLELLRDLMLYGTLGVNQENPLPELPIELNHNNLYYLYVGNAR